MFLGGKSSFADVVHKHQEAIRRLMLHLTLGDEMLSDDLAQETFMKAYNSWHTFRGLSNTRTWLFRIAYNTFYSYCRENNMTQDKITELSAISSQQSSLSIDLQEAMKLLNSIERTCITLALIEGEKTKEIATIVGLKENTVKSHVKRGREKLAKYLKENGY